MGGKKGQAAGFVPAPCMFQEGLSPAQAALASSIPSSESGSKPQLKQYRKTGKENKTERLFFPRSHTLFVGCSGVGTEHSEGVFTAHPAWDGVQEACELHGVSAQAAGAGPDRAKPLLPAPRAIAPHTNMSQAPAVLYLAQKQRVPATQTKTTHPIWRYLPLLAGQENVPRTDQHPSRASRQTSLKSVQKHTRDT